MGVLVATWNVNSLRARLPRVEQFLLEHSPDVLLLQETKCSPEQFPSADLELAGYRAIEHSGGRWCGVAALVPADVELRDSSFGLPGEPDPGEARWVETTFAGIRFVSVYVPNGREVDSPHFEQKLDFLAAAANRVSELAKLGPLIVGGDMNVAPRDEDVWDISSFSHSTHVSEPERAALRDVLAAGEMVDAHVHLHGDQPQFTWWDYRGGSFHRGFGMRIDHILASSGIAERIKSCAIARDYRKGEKPSDHVPLLVTLSD